MWTVVPWNQVRVRGYYKQVAEEVIMTVKRLITLVSTNWLHETVSGGLKSAANGAGLRILDTSFVTDKSVDSCKEFYQKGHIPYSLFFDLHKCVESTPLIPRNLPDVNCFTDYVQSLGISSNTHVIAYDRFGPLSSFRTWWTFRLFGHKKISVLDGGLQKWVNDGYEVTTEEPKVERSKFEAVMNPSLLRTFDDMMINLSNKTEQVIDARDADKFDGTAVEEGGHIPGAKNIPFQSLFNEDGTMKSEHDLKALFDAAGIDLGKPVVAQCRTGMTACGIAMAAHILGKEIVPLYYGSWLEWSQRVGPQYIAKGKS